jgi:hypothetical protein
MSKGNYVAANKIFRGILESGEVIPSEMCYYFAETLYMLGQYQNSMNFIDKYFELTGKAGDYYHEVTDLKKLVESKTLIPLQCSNCDRFGYVIRTCTNCLGEGTEYNSCHFCHGMPNVTCTTCHGDGVIIETNKFSSSSYKTCHTCNGTGRKTCPVCNGKYEIEKYCSVCSGTGYESSEELCTHPDLHDHN